MGFWAIAGPIIVQALSALISSKFSKGQDNEQGGGFRSKIEKIGYPPSGKEVKPLTEGFRRKQ